MLSPFLVSPLKNTLSLPPPSAQQTTHSFFLALAVPSNVAKNLPRTKDLLPLMTNQAFLTYIFS